MKPIYTHDCDCCKFLGHYEYDETTYDLYYCNQNGNPTLIARHGSEGPEYISGKSFVGVFEPISEAGRRAVQELLIEGLESGEPIPLDKNEWDQIRGEVK